MKNNAVIEIDGRRLYYTFIAGAKKILENQIELNKINVFPVNDGDTGTNLASTIRAVIDSIHPNKSYKVTADLIAEATLVNARGNSGIIFAQFMYGLSNETGNHGTITINQFAESIKNSVRYVYEAVANPVEGTMLTVIKDWADYIYDNRKITPDFNQLLIKSKAVLEKSLFETKAKLAVLAKNNVVDAGAKGFVLFIEGIIEFIITSDLRHLLKSKTEIVLFSGIDDHVSEEITHRFCTEAILKNINIDSHSLNEVLKSFGDSLVVAGSDKTKRIHIHTDSPADLFYHLKDYGTITFQKADDMVRQSEAVYNRKWKIALVTDSTCDLSTELIDQYQINMLPININFGDNHYLDKVTIHPEHFYKLLDSSNEFPKTAQVNEKAFINLYSHLASHYDSIIAVHLTDKFSGTFHSSQKAAQAISKEFNKPISVINSKNLSGALGLITLRIAQAIDQGQSHDRIVEMTEKWVADSRIYVSVKTLKYMVKGGRVSHFKGLIAKLLNVNPIVSMDENGKSLVFGKTYSQKSNMEKVMEHIKDISKEKSIWNYIILHANNHEGAQWYTDKMKLLTGKEPTSVVNISPVIGANAGIGAASVAFMFE
ncbi:MAG: DegV family EDD domain-containing protein [Bacteroidales bacterium]|nr:MAG: DegV family EDD domain-containing protein [Bacteroidales bacterium]